MHEKPRKILESFYSKTNRHAYNRYTNISESYTPIISQIIN